MSDKNISAITRRDFIRRAACAAVGTAAMTSAIRDLRFMNAAVAQSNIGPTITRRWCAFFSRAATTRTISSSRPSTSEYNNYAAIRTPVLALPSGFAAEFDDSWHVEQLR